MAKSKIIKEVPVALPPFKLEPILMKAGINTDWSHDFYKILDAHKKGYKGKGVKVAVLDTGVELTNDAFTKAVDEKRLKAIDARRNQNNPNDIQGHGTWCCSRYIADDEEVLGFAPECEVVSIKVLNDNGSGSLSDVVRGYEMAIDEGVDIISTSLGSPGTTAAMQNIVRKARDLGIILISAAGNDGTREGIDYPALYDEVYSIGSHDEIGKRASHSDWGVDLDLYGSGVRVRGAWSGNRITFAGGTSMATPSIGGCIALFLPLLKENYQVIDRDLFKKIATCL